MITVRKEQMDALSESMVHGFVRRMVVQLRSRFDATLHAATDDQLAKLVAFGIERAKPYGVVSEGDVSRYLEYMVEYGHDFDKNPRTAWAQSILTAPNTSGSKKMDDLDSFTTFELRK